MVSVRALWLGSLFLLVGCQCQGPDARDGGREDSGVRDSGTDAAVPDAGVSDAGTNDGGKTDGGPMDSGVHDGGGTDGGMIDGGSSDAGGRFCDSYDRAVCDWYAACGQLDSAQTADCVALQAWACSQQQVDAVIDAGKLTFAAASVPACLQATRTFSCARSFPAAPACDALFVPATSVGGTCTRQWSTLCSGSYCSGQACPAQCAAFVAVDAGCSGTEGDQCGPNAYCGQGSPRVCIALLAPGAPCNANDFCGGGTCDTAQLTCLVYGSQNADAGCASDSVCRDGLYCKAGSCRPSEVLGGPCRLYGGADCASSFTCRIWDAGTTGTCQPRSGRDGGCFGLPADCEDGLSCDSPMLFAAGSCLGSMSAGQPCVHSIQNCKVGLLCDETTHLCRTLPRVSDPCVRDPGNFKSSDCVGGFCPPDAGADGGRRCLAPQPAGAACDRPWECESTDCENGVCVALCTSF